MDRTGRRLGHYLIQEKLGAGGMGVVYRAQDEVLQRSVAVKLLPADKAGDPERRERFLREARAASALNHPGIVTIHELGEQEGQTFIVMEYVEGRSLREALQTGGLRDAGKLEIAISAGEALAAAHARGLIHRDLKPDNIMVTPNGRAKILDFGLAKLREPGSDQATETAVIAGTPAYMAPEQLRGQSADARADIYAFGLILKEMGFVEAGSRASRPEPSDRYQSMSELLAAISEAPAKPSRRIWTVSALLILAAVFGGLLWFRGMRGQESPPGGKRRAVAVLYFRNLTRDASLNWLDAGLTEMLATSLSEFRGFDVLSTERVQAAAQRAGRGGDLSPGVALEVARQAGADVFVTGALIREGPTRLRIDVKLQDAAAGQILAAEKIEGQQVEAVFSMVDQLSARLARSLEATPGAAGRPRPIEEAATANVEAYRHYQAGLDYRRRFLYQEALREFEEALRLDPGFVLARWQLCATHAPLGDLRRAEEMLKEVERQISRLPRKERFLVEARRAGMSGDFAAEQRTLEAVLREFPRDAEGRLRLCAVYRRNNQEDRAVQILREGLGLDPRDDSLWNELGYAEIRRGNLAAALEANDRYRALLPSDPNPADTRGDILFVAGRTEEAIAAYRQVLQVKPDFNSGLAEFKIALALADQGDFRQADEAFRQFGQHAGENARRYRTLLEAQLLEQRGDLAGAQASYRRAVQELGRAGQTVIARSALMALGRIAAALDDLPSALAFARGQKLLGEEHLPVAVWETMLGHTAVAERSLAQFTALRPQFTGHAQSQVLAAARLSAALRRADRTAVQAELAAVPDSEDFALLRGEALFLEGDYPAAEKALRTAILHERIFLSSLTLLNRAPLDEHLAHLHLARVLAAAGRTAEAVAAYQRFLKFCGGGRPQLKEVAQARAALKRLESGTAAPGKD